jgi:DNA-directed RNA polymerase subunit beta
VTNDIPNVSEATKDLDENGMIRIGAEVNQVTFLWKNYSKGNQILLRRELLRAIFGDEAGDVRCFKGISSLQV